MTEVGRLRSGQVGNIILTAFKIATKLITNFSPYEGEEANKEEEAVTSRSVACFVGSPTALF